jgi:hypothetical protein
MVGLYWILCVRACVYELRGRDAGRVGRKEWGREGWTREREREGGREREGVSEREILMRIIEAFIIHLCE